MQSERIKHMNNRKLRNYRPLKIIHTWKTEGKTLEENCILATNKLGELADKGFGGVVANVSFGTNLAFGVPPDPNAKKNAVADDKDKWRYLNDEEDWVLFRHIMDEADRLGMRAWIYDEKFYPSGGAGGLTLREHPEYCCRAIAKITTILEPGESRTVKLPRGHLRFLYGASYICRNGAEEPEELTPIQEIICEGDENALSFTNSSPKNQIVCAFADKYLYEGTHSQHNVREARRYPDMMNKDAVRLFVENTYMPYTKHAGKHYANGTGMIESFFTDEPSLMGCYLNFDLYPFNTLDPYDDTLPLYPIVNFGRDVEKTFEEISGMKLRENLVCLFYGDTPHAKKVRYYYYMTTSKLFEESFYKQLSAYCAENSVSFGGHLILEEDIRHHVIFEGNFFSLMRHMHTPSIDMLQSLPENVRRDMFTPKLISSIAHAYDRPHVMSEASAFAQGGRTSAELMYASVALQYAFGVDIFTYYYPEDLLDTENYRKYNLAVERFGELMADGTHKADVLVYYPIETFMMNHHTSEGNQRYTFAPEETACKNGLYAMLNALCDAQIDYDLADLDVLKSLEIKDGKLMGRCGAEYKYLLLSPMEMTEEMLDAFAALEAQGVKICMTVDPLFPEQSKLPFGKIFENASEIIRSFDRSLDGFALEMKSNCPGVVCLCREINRENRYFFVNSENKPIEIDCILNNVSTPTLYDPLEDVERPIQITEGDAGKHCRFTLGGYDVVIVK